MEEQPTVYDNSGQKKLAGNRAYRRRGIKVFPSSSQLRKSRRPSEIKKARKIERTNKTEARRRNK